jgi:predicted acetyltransferase
MSDFTVRPVAEGEQRACHTVLLEALHASALSDEAWEPFSPAFPAERKFAAFAGETPVGVVSSRATEVMVPGGALVPMASVDGVAVRADWTRRGVMSAMMAAQLADLVARGEPLAGLTASEATIYGRFGYGPATYVKSVHIAKARVRWRPGVGGTGRVRLLDAQEAVKLPPEIYPKCGSLRPGMMTRPDGWWPEGHNWLVTGGGRHRVAVHTGPDGDDGFVVFQTKDQRTFDHTERGARLAVQDLHGATVDVRTALWRFVLSVDLVAEVNAHSLPVDEPLGEMFTDPRACRVISIDDELWLRLLDVEAALNARTYSEAEPVVVEIEDRQLPTNSGRYLISASGAKRTSVEAHVRLDVDTLAMLYLSEWRASSLVQTGRVEVLDAAAPSRLDELFRTAERRPWCGTHF